MHEVSHSPPDVRHDAVVIAVIPPAVPVESAAGAQALPFHLRTCPLVAEACASFDGAIPAATFASVTAEFAMSAVAIVPSEIFAEVTAESATSAVATVPSVMSADATADFEASEPSPAIEEESEESCESTETKFETILFHSEDESTVHEDAVETVWRAE